MPEEVRDQIQGVSEAFMLISEALQETCRAAYNALGRLATS